MTFKKPFIISALWLAFAGFSGTAVALSGLYLYLSPKLPAVETLRDVKLQTPLRVYSSDGKLIGEYGEKRRTPIRYTDIPQPYIKAILAAEDDQFYSHYGVSIKGLLRASSQLLLTGHIQSGGSTITMQVARNFFLTRHQTFARKFNEILLALQIERELTKEEILELYVNVIFLGNRAYGIQSAARVYYGKDIADLNLAQLAMIAGLPKAPSAYNPIVNPARALIRRNWILGRMKELGYIDKATYDTALAEPVTAKYHGLNLELDAPYVAEMARKKAIEELGEAVYTDGYRIYTTVDSRLQQAAQRAVIDGLLTYDQRHGYRGPEQRLEVPSQLVAANLKPAATNEEANGVSLAAVNFAPGPDTPPVDLTPWKKALDAIPTYAGLQPAAVTRVHEKSVQALLADGRIISIGWQQGLAFARPHITENRRGAKPRKAADVLEVGDVIRVAEQEGKWHLHQVPTAQAALVALNPENGAIVSLVGGFDFSQSHFNRATQAARQPGSNFKPFIYTAALENGFTPATIINDAPIVFDDASLEGTWRPENNSGKFYGPTRLRQALYKSRNLVSIRVLNSMGIHRAIAGMDRFGFDKEQLPHDLSLALGSYALTPLQVAAGYTVFANGGYRVEPFLVDRIVDVEGKVIYQSTPLTVCRKCEDPEPVDRKNTDPLSQWGVKTSQEESDSSFGKPLVDTAAAETPAAIAGPSLPRAPRVLDAQVAYMIDSMLRDVVKKGTGVRANVLQRGDLAGKTGTTNGPRDAWFSGYNHHIVATTWLGFDQNRNLGLNEYGGSAALPIWINFMRTALEGVPEVVREQPDGIVTVSIDPKTGKRALPGSRDAIFEIFRANNLPALTDLNDSDNDLGNEDAPPEDLF